MEKFLLNIKHMFCYSIRLTWSREGLANLTTSILLYLDGDIQHNSYTEIITKMLSVFYILIYILTMYCKTLYLTLVDWFKSFVI